MLRVAALLLALLAVARAFQPLARPLPGATARARAWTMPAATRRAAPTTTMLAVDPSSILADAGYVASRGRWGELRGGSACDELSHKT